jgi:hypothetical protein
MRWRKRHSHALALDPVSGTAGEAGLVEGEGAARDRRDSSCVEYQESVTPPDAPADFLLESHQSFQPASVEDQIRAWPAASGLPTGSDPYGDSTPARPSTIEAIRLAYGATGNGR